MQWHLNAVTALPRRKRSCSPPRRPAPSRRSGCGESAYGVQFHMEVDAALVSATEAFPDYIAALEREQGAGAFDRMVAADDSSRKRRCAANGGRLFQNFVGLMDNSSKCRPAA